MKYCVYLLSLMCLLSSCVDSSSGCDPEEIILSAENDKEITTVMDTTIDRLWYTLDDGQNIVFKYYRIAAQCDEIYDDEYSELLAFEIGKDRISGEFIDEEIRLTQCFIHQSGAWVNQYYAVDSGSIRVERQSENKWEIDVAVWMPPSFNNDAAKLIEFSASVEIQ